MSSIKFCKIFDDLYINLNNHSKNLDIFISKNDQLASIYKDAAKSIYDYSFSKVSKLKPLNLDLPELFIEGFDNEQIWQQINLPFNNITALQNELMVPFSTNTKKRCREGFLTNNGNSPKKVRFSDVQYDDDVDDDIEEDDESDKDKLLIDNDNMLNEDEKDYDSADELKIDKLINENESIFKEGVDSDEDEDENLKKVLQEYKHKLQQDNDNINSNDEINEEKDDNILESDQSSVDETNEYGDPIVRLKEAIENSKSKNSNTSNNIDKVEDRFLNLKQMEDFVKEAETIKDEQSDDEMSIDDLTNDESNVKYGDFFENSDEEEIKNPNLLDSSCDESEEKEDLEKRVLIRESTNENLSTLEKRTLSMQKKILELEKSNLATKPWQMKGEITSKSRPENSLLDEVLEFDTTAKPAPIITEEVTKSIEDKIIERLKSNIWDGPKRKVKVKESEFILKKKIILDQEKSKLSLEQIYENEYLQQNQTDEKEPEEFDEIRNSMTSLFRKLDALSNYHYAPKPAIPDLRIISNLPSMTVEEAIPDAISNAMLLAPQEILEKKKGDLVGSTELSKTDRLRARRSKKLRQHFKRLDKENKDKIKKIKTNKNNILKNLKEDLKINEKVDNKKRNIKKSNKKKK